LLFEGIRGIGKKTLIHKIQKKAQIDGFITIQLDALHCTKSPINTLFNLLANNLSKEESKNLFKRLNDIFYLLKQKQMLLAEVQKENYTIDLYINLSNLLFEYSKVKPILIVLFNIEDFDEDFLRFIAYMEHAIEAKSIDSIILIASANTDATTKAKSIISAVSAHKLTDIVSLEPFKEHDLKELVKKVFNRDLFLDKELEFILDKTKGIPLFIIDLLKHLISIQAINKRDGIWHVNTKIYSEISIPKSYDDLFLNKYKGLCQTERRILQIIATYDGKLKVAELSEISNIDSIGLVKLIDSGILKLEDANIDFVHPVYREVIKKHTSIQLRRKINYLIASYLESKRPNESITIAKYYLRSSDIIKAYKYGIKAAKTLVSKNELYRAFNYLNDLKGLLQKVGDKEKLVRVLEYLAPLEELLGLLDKAINDYQYIIANTKHDVLKAMCMLKLAAIEIYKLGHINIGKMLCKKAVRIAIKSNNKAIIALSLARASDFKKGKEKENMLLTAKELAKYEDPNIYSVILCKILYYYKFKGATKSISKYLEEAMRIIGKLSYDAEINFYNTTFMIKFYESEYDYIINMINSLFKNKKFLLTHHAKNEFLKQLGGIYYVQGNYVRMIQTLEDLLADLILQRNYADIILTMFNIVIAYKAICNYNDALKLLHEIHKIRKEKGVKRDFEINTLPEARLYLALGKDFKKEYDNIMKASKRIILKIQNVFRLGHYYLITADENYNKLRLKRSLTALDKAIKLFKKVNSRDDLCESLLKKSIILCELGQPKRARLYIKQAWNIYEQIHCEYLKPQLLLARGMVERLNGEDKAIETLREALKVSRKQLTREQTWQIQREMALYYRGKGQYRRALKYYKDAVEITKQITESIPTEEIKLSYLEVPFRKRVFEEIKELKKRLVN